jgi:hypothetical protein
MLILDLKDLVQWQTPAIPPIGNTKNEISFVFDHGTGPKANQQTVTIYF